MALKRYLVAFAGCALLILGLGLYWFMASAPPRDSQVSINLPLRQEQVVEREPYPGFLIPIRDVSVKTNTTGRIVKVHVKAGDHVRARDLLCELDDRINRAQLDAARAKLKLAESRYRAAAAVDDAADDAEEAKIKLGVAKANVDAAEAECASAEHRLADTKIRAPFDGTIMKVLIEKDARVDPFDPAHCTLFELADLSRFLVQVNFPQNEWRKVRRGQRGRVEIPSLPQARFEGEVVDIDTKVDMTTDSFGARVEIEPADGGELLMAGMVATVSLKDEEPLSGKTPH